MTLIEGCATFFGLICVWLTIKQNIWCWPSGLIQVILYIVIFYSVRLYSDMVLQIIYIPVSIFGWYHWKNGRHNQKPVPVSLTGKPMVIWVLVGITGTLAWGHLMDTQTDAALPYPDAFIAVSSLIAQWLMAKKKLESWIIWILVDLVAIGVYFCKSLYFTTVLYAVFLVLAILGYLEWKRSFLIDKTAAETQK